MSEGRTRRLYRALVRLLPPAFRAPLDDELERAAVAWVASERARKGRLGEVRAWWGIAGDTIRAAIAIRARGWREDVMGVLSDLQLAVRTLARAPGFTAAAMMTFALGIGVNIAVFSVVDRMMFRPLPYGDADRLVHLSSVRGSRGPSPEAYLPDILLQTLRTRSQSFADLAAASGRQAPIAIDGLGAPLVLDLVSANLLRVLQVRPIAGRDFVDDDARRGVPERAILLTDEAWQQRLGRSHDVFSRAFAQGPDIYRVVGILPRGFIVPASTFGGRIDGVLIRPESRVDATDLGPAAIGRLRPGVGPGQAQAEVNVIVEQLKQEHPKAANVQVPVTVRPARSGLFYYYRPYAWLIVAGVSGVFLVACVNLATLLLARGRAREQDMAIRTALGASRARIVRAALAESIVLCVASAAVAVLVCHWTFGGVLSIVPAPLQGVAVSPLDARLLAITTAAALAAALFAGCVPALRAVGVDVMTGLRSESRSTTGRLRGATTLIAVQVALGVLLVMSAAATVRSFVGLAFKSPGYTADGLYELRLSHGTDERRAAAVMARLRGSQETGVIDNTLSMGFMNDRVRDVMETVRGVPGIRAAAAVDQLLVGKAPGSSRDPFWQSRELAGRRTGIGGGFFDALETPVLAGRPITDADVETRALVAVANELAVRALWPGTRPIDAIGHVVSTADGPRRIVGIVADVRPLPAIPALPTLFLPITANEIPFMQTNMSVAVRAMPGYEPDLVAIDARLDARFGPGTARITRIADAMPPHLQRPRFQAVLFGSVSLIGMLLAAVGLYAVAALDAARRRFEMGVRLTLGAAPRDLRRLLIWRTVRPVAVGTTAGLAVAWLSGPALQPFVFEVDVRDPWTAAFVAALMLATGVVAAWLPARRASRTDPATILRAT